VLSSAGRGRTRRSLTRLMSVGALDPGRAPRDAPEIARRIPSCAVHTCEDEGHFVLIPR
jgi:hypothetical protein